MLANSPISALLPVVNVERARSFYQDKLGLQLNEDFSTEGASVFVCGNGTQLVLYQRETPTTADHTAASWMVSDIEATVRQLSANGVEFEQYDQPGIKTDAQGIAGGNGMRGAWFKDPEGNILSVVQFGG